jgi:hypothetical protein
MIELADGSIIGRARARTNAEEKNFIRVHRLPIGLPAEEVSSKETNDRRRLHRLLIAQRLFAES